MEEIKQFPELYKFTNNKVHVWGINVKKIKLDHYRLHYYYGEKDGAITEKTSDITEGKQKRTVLEQAEMEANRKWINKKDKNLYLPHNDFEKLKKESTIIVRPMLANNFKPELYTKSSRSFKIEISNEKPALIQRKLDGIRCLSHLKNGEIILETRTGTHIENFDLLRKNLKNIFELLGENVYLDGELFTQELSFEEISGTVRKSKKKITDDKLEMIDKINYNVYDIIFLDNLNMTFAERNLKLEYIFNEFKFPNIVQVKSIYINNYQDVQKYHDQFVYDEDFEGIMIRDPASCYEIDKRSKYLQKYKNFNDGEFKIIDFTYEMNKNKKMVIWVCEHKDKTFNCVPNGTNEYRIEMFKNAEDQIGKLLTVKYFGMTEEGKGVPRMPKGIAIRDYE